MTDAIFMLNNVSIEYLLVSDLWDFSSYIFYYLNLEIVFSK